MDGWGLKRFSPFWEEIKTGRSIKYKLTLNIVLYTPNTNSLELSTHKYRYIQTPTLAWARPGLFQCGVSHRWWTSDQTISGN